MYDTARRVVLVKQRVRENTRRRQRRSIHGLSAACMLLFAALMQTAGTVIAPGQPEAWGVFGAMLLREDAGGYVLVGVVSFTAAAAITALCIRLRSRENQKKRRGGQARPAETGGKNDMKKRILSILLLCCMVLTLLPVTAFAAGGAVRPAATQFTYTLHYDANGGSGAPPSQSETSSKLSVWIPISEKNSNP